MFDYDFSFFPVRPSVRPSGGKQGREGKRSFRQEFERAAEQICLSEIPEGMREQAYEICLIIAEVYYMQPSFSVKIGGEALEVSLVEEIFSEVTQSHVELVIENFNSVSSVIRNKKAYLRTALYNAVFELSSHYSNRVCCEIYGDKGKGKRE